MQILGWQPGFQTVSAILALQANTRLSLTEAKLCIERVLEGQIATIEPLSAEHRVKLERALADAGAVVGTDSPATASFVVTDNLLAELCVDLGYCSAHRSAELFSPLWRGTIETLADALLTAEGLDPFLHRPQRVELCQWLTRRLGVEPSA